MDILIPDNWLRDFLETKATPKQLAKYLSLCGPSVDKVEKKKNDHVYHIEITTNRVDSANVYGIAREGAVILPRFKIKANFKPLRTKAHQNFAKKVSYLEAKVNHKLCPRFTAILIRNVKIGPSPKYIKERLGAIGVKLINNVVDISNYIMHEIGQPVHTFDYDKILGAKMVLRASKKGEEITTLDGETHKLPGNDIVIEDGKGRLIDLAGIMGGENSAVDKNTKNVLLFVQTYNPVNIRHTSMSLAHRTEAAMLFEKGLDPELVSLAIRRGIDLFVKLTGGKPASKILDIYPEPYKAKKITTDIDFIDQRLGISLPKKEISKILTALGFESSWKGKKLEVLVPSFRTNDVGIPEDVLEEIARIYGYHNFPSELMAGVVPDPLFDTPFDFEMTLKNILAGWGGIEVYTFSMVPKEYVGKNALRLTNPLGIRSKHMRTSLMSSLTEAAKENLREKDPFHIFEVANIYLPKKGNLPEEKMILAGIFVNYSYRKAKGIVEKLLEKLNINYSFETEDSKGFLPSQRLLIKMKNKKLGQLGVLEEGFIYYEFDPELLRLASNLRAYTPISKYPAQIEDITLTLPERTRVGDVVSSIKSSSKLIQNVELTDIYKDAYTFRLWYQHSRKTLTDKEVETIRKKLLTQVKKKFGAILKG
ncbi:phenylalanine--tRNA ligase subunit beta [Candidatus Woesebacteria bacterium]|nr:phenylalanine--tRNA ligase subunit beta [Candidatus Woesebacteria bacterium]